MKDLVMLLCPCCGEEQELPEEERDPNAPLYALNDCDGCTMEALDDD